MNSDKGNYCVCTKLMEASYYKKGTLVMKLQKPNQYPKTIIGSDAKLAIDIPVIMRPAIRKYKE